MIFPSFTKEQEYLERGYAHVGGCDEAGRGPLAGPVVAAVCVLDPASIGAYRSKHKWYARIRDSKTVLEDEREALAREITARATAWGTGIVSEEEIDRLNIHYASLEAMRRAVLELAGKMPQAKGKFMMLVDGKFAVPDLRLGAWSVEQESIVDGDALSLSIAAASIIAKVERDAIMRELDKRFPAYGFARHKGYSTKEHQQALREFGITSVHRKSFVKI